MIIYPFELSLVFLLFCFQSQIFGLGCHYMGGDITHFQWMQNGSKCLADLCGALHCDHMMKTRSSKAKCNPAAVARNRHLCEVAF